MTAPRGIRNNNPGNIRRSPEAWVGLAVTQSDPEFFQFLSMPYGIRAMAKILRSYQAKYGLKTVRGLIFRWAPPTENDAAGYAASVAKAVGVDLKQVIQVADSEILFKLIRAIIRQENGSDADTLIDDATVRKGIQL